MATAPILFVNGSLRAASFSTAVLRAAATFVPDTYPVEFADLVRELPFYDGDLEDDAAPDAVRAVRARLAASAGLVVATPEYNAGLPGGLKNVFDWATRPPRAHSLVGKPVAVIGASPGPGGAKKAVESLGLMSHLGVAMIDDPVTVPSVHERLDAERRPDEALAAELAALIARLMAQITTG